MASRREVTAAVAVRYQSSTRNEKESILNEFTQVKQAFIASMLFVR